ncbi:MAG: CPBP family intramembrane glutamic endopeptidase [Casimicrobium sp.]
MRSTSLYSSETARGWLTWGVLAPILLILFVAIPAVVGAKVRQYFHLADVDWKPIGMAGWVALLVIEFAATGLLVLAWVRWVERRSLASIGLTHPGGGALFLRGLGVGVVTSFGVVAAIWIAGGYAADGYAKAFASPTALMNIVILLLCFMVQAGIEEIIFRGWLMSVLARKFNVIIAVAGTCIVFAALHFGRQTPWLDTVLTLLFSLFACCWALKAGNIWGVMGWHAGWNWLLAVGFEVPITGLDTNMPALLVKLVPQVTPGSHFLNGGTQGPEGSLLCGLFFIIAIAWLLLRAPSTSARAT